jgi:CubicO group peptidase (beta-lactamase class C family)
MTRISIARAPGISVVLDGEGALKSTAADLLTHLDANLHPEKYAANALPGMPLVILPPG